MSELLKYSIEGLENLQVLIDEETVWLTQAQMAELFQTSKQNISLHIRNVFKERELDQKSVVKDYLTTALDGKNYRTQYYNLDVIISVGYRVKSQRGTQFRMWATRVLKEYMLKGYAVHRPVSKKELDEVKEELIRQINNLDIEVDAKVSEIYDFLITWLGKKTDSSSKPRPRMGF